MKLLKLTVPAAFAAAAAFAGLAPATAGTVMPKQPMLAAHADGVTLVAAKKKKKRARHVQRYYNDGYADEWAAPAYPPGYAGGPPYWNRDTVGSTGYNGTPYGYNRYSGRQNYECKIDLGYGRTVPCDAGTLR